MEQAKTVFKMLLIVAEVLPMKRGVNGDPLVLPAKKCPNQLFVLVNMMDIVLKVLKYYLSSPEPCGLSS